ncbi:HAMP domain-containing sensor histidine kinase [Seohaeicola sp. SP36]|uniref:sensor histidine kinase n=1 Tax=unclassified Seohaeicola TaxID=2641111 RepID=UPI00237C0C9E|nr:MULTISPECIES: HAMP domain-containing sensor histidine kinase [unclassified Seohaeicola]MDD9706024.1 HAMP domain-containing sensor histidine kinase [Seohaeicola sp. 4SK31]MDD9734483.1 HAMP domain-containing sensor histidine kinase [Seohaeicola sp. SP36]
MTALSLRWRLMVAGAVAVVLALGLAALGLAHLFGTHVERRALADLSVQLDRVLAGLARVDGALAQVLPPADPRFEQPYSGLYWQIAADGAVLRSRSLWDVELALPVEDGADATRHNHLLIGPEGAEVLVLEQHVTLPASLGAGRARAAVALDTAELGAARRAFLRDMFPYLAVLGMVLIAAQWAQVTLGLKPLRRVGAEVSALRDGRRRRMGGDWPQEVQPLAAELDALLTAREADVERARGRAGDLAHGLKTPLQALMGEAARLRAADQAQAAEGIEVVVVTMRAHVDRELARTRIALHSRNARAGAAAVARSVVAVLQRTPGGQRLAWQVDVPDDLLLAIDAADLSEALGALAENAARHAAGRVEVGAVVMGAQARVTVRDDGPGLPADRRAAMMARGVRADETGPGTGLGLAIAAEIAEAAGGVLELEEAGPGLSATLVLPLA